MSRFAFVVALCLLAAIPAGATTYTVNNLGDAPDATPGNDVCATAGAVCTLRAALQEANAHFGSDAIRFSVTGTISPATDLPGIASPLDLHGNGNIILQGLPILNALDIGLAGGGSVIRGMQIHGFRIGIYLHTVNDVVIGGTAPGDGNVLSGNEETGILGVGVGALEVYGNTIGLNAARTAAFPNGLGIDLQSSQGPRQRPERHSSQRSRTAHD